MKRAGEGKVQVRCAIYTRVSVDEKRLDSAGVWRGKKEDTSLRMQEQLCRTYVEQRTQQGFVLQGVYQDDGFSAKSLNRPALKRLIAAIDAGEVDSVVVYKIDRLTRSVADFYELARSWFEKDISFVSASQSFSTLDVSGRLMLNILLTFAQFERELTSERTANTRALRIMDGKFTGGEIPFGFRRRPGGGIEIADTAEIVRRIFDEAASGSTPSEIAADLRRDRIARPTKRGKSAWNSTVVRQMIENERYRGVQTLGDREFPQEHGQIVSRDIWELANARLPEVTPALRVEDASPYLLVGRGVCGICGQPLAGYEANGRNDKYAYYTCRRARKAAGGRKCDLGNLRVEHLDHLVAEALAVVGRHPALCKATLEAMRPEQSPENEKITKRLEAIARTCTELESNLPEFQKLISDPKRPALAERMKDEVESILTRLTELKNEKRVLEARQGLAKERTANLEAVVAAFERMPAIFAALPPAERKELVGALVQRIVVKPWNGEKAGIIDGALSVTPTLGTKRYFVKITVYESALLSAALTNSVDGSTLEKIGCALRWQLRKIEASSAPQDADHWGRNGGIR